MTEKRLLSVEDLKTYFYTRAGVVRAVDGVSFHLNHGEALGLAGESGCGKSVTCSSILKLIPPGCRIVGGRIIFEGEDLATKREGEMRQWRGQEIAMILQDPLMSLNPVYTIGNQVGESFRLSEKHIDKADLRRRVLEVLKKVRIPSAEARLNSYPFQFSGGMRQRTAAAIAIARSPKLLIADEPTTALDVTIQDQFICLLKEIQESTKMGLIMVSHDLAIIAECCDRVAIMYGGKIVETGEIGRVYREPAHPYTRALMQALPKLGSRRKRLFQIDGEPPNPMDLPPGCSFHPRCPQAEDICRSQYPPVTTMSPEDAVACWLFSEGGA